MKTVKTVKKALAILDSFTRYNKIQGVTEISSKLNINKSTTHAILATLREEGYVIYESKARKYSLGFKPFELAGRIVYKSDIRDLALPIMERCSIEHSSGGEKGMHCACGKPIFRSPICSRW
jgi:DNA-binding IclR family transcriptional regulator